MAYRDNPLGALVRGEPAEAARKISAFLAANDGAIGATASAFGVDGATLRRWIAKLRGDGHEVGPVRTPGPGRGDRHWTRRTPERVPRGKRHWRARMAKKTGKKRGQKK